MAQYSNALLLRADTPPTFLLHAADEASVPVAYSWPMFEALRGIKVDAALHVFEAGATASGSAALRGRL